MSSSGAAGPDTDAPAGEGLELAQFAAGCFWSVELVYQRLPGVARTEVGYSQGHLDGPTYPDVCGDGTGHAEVVRVHYDPKECPYAVLLDVFWAKHNPTTLNRQVEALGGHTEESIATVTFRLPPHRPGLPRWAPASAWRRWLWLHVPIPWLGGGYVVLRWPGGCAEPPPGAAPCWAAAAHSSVWDLRSWPLPSSPLACPSSSAGNRGSMVSLSAETVGWTGAWVDARQWWIWRIPPMTSADTARSVARKAMAMNSD